jgi:DNA-binding MarR family transcriptional regulator
MAQTVRELEAAGLVVRTPDNVDRRKVIVAITEYGREVLEQDRLRREEWFTQAISEAFTPHEQEILLEAIPLLSRLSARR